MRQKILFADRSIKDLEAIKTLLDKQYDIFLTDNAKSALEIIEAEKIELIFADINLVLPDGGSFLIKSKERFPEVPRIILGWKEEEKVFSALQKNIAKTCIFRPLENEKILTLINQIFETEKQLKDSKILSLIVNFDELPTIRKSYQKILQLIDDDREITEISKEIEYDPSIASKILRVANSAYYGVRTGSIRQAVTYLGLKNIRALVLSSSIFDIFNENDLPERIFQPLWQQAFMGGKIIHTMYRMLGKKMPDLAISAGLLMNIGIVFFLKVFGKQYMPIMQQIRQRQDIKEGISLENLEKEIFGITHSLAGSYLLNWWEMPYPIVETALYHHCPLNESVIDRELLCIMHITEYYSAKFTYSENHGILLQDAFDYLGITASELEEKIAKL